MFFRNLHQEKLDYLLNRKTSSLLILRIANYTILAASIRQVMLEFTFITFHQLKMQMTLFGAVLFKLLFLSADYLKQEKLILK